MTAPFYKFGFFNFDASLVVALAVGFAFGFFLERGGLGNAKKLAAQFYFTDLAVFKVMFTAIVTAMLGLFWLSWLGLVDDSLVYVNPTYVFPQLIAGLIFGVGFVIGGLCPGTCLVASATGKIDGLVALLGIFFGIFAFGELFALFDDVLYFTSWGHVTFPRLLHIPQGLIVLGVVMMALGGFAGAELIERRKLRVQNSHAMGISPGKFRLQRVLALGALVLALFSAVVGNPSKDNRGSSITVLEERFDGVTLRYLEVQELADRIMEKKDDFDILDVRSKMQFETYHIPFAKHAPEGSVRDGSVVDKEVIIVYTQYGTVPRKTLMALGEIGTEEIYCLKGGLNAWMETILFPDISGSAEMNEDQKEKRMKISRYFGGQPRFIEKKDQLTRQYKREGC